MSLTYLGSLTVGGAVDGGAAGINAGVAGLQPSKAIFDAHLEGMAAFNPPAMDFAAQLQQAIDIQLNIALGMGVIPEPPSKPELEATMKIEMAAYTAILEGIEASLALLVDLQKFLDEAGIHAYAFDGPASALGGELTSALAGGVPGGSGGGQHANAVIMVTTIPASWVSLGNIVKVSP